MLQTEPSSGSLRYTPTILVWHTWLVTIIWATYDHSLGCFTGLSIESNHSNGGPMDVATIHQLWRVESPLWTRPHPPRRSAQARAVGKDLPGLGGGPPEPASLRGACEKSQRKAESERLKDRSPFLRARGSNQNGMGRCAYVRPILPAKRISQSS